MTAKTEYEAATRDYSVSTETRAGLLDRIVEEQARQKAAVASRYQPVMSTVEMVEREKAIQYLVDNIMVEGVDYGWVPGTRPTKETPVGEYRAKPTLFKAGAERVCAFFGYVPEYHAEQTIEEWTAAKYGEALFYYRYRCTLSKDGAPVGQGIGSGSTWESKYRYRNAERTCPDCGKANIRKSKPKPGQRVEAGFYCWDKTGGCGATFTADDERIAGQETGKIPNSDIADVINTVQKMAQKRAYVAGVLTATGLSARFTQDLEDLPVPAQPAAADTPPIKEQLAQRVAEEQPKPMDPVEEFTQSFRAADKYGRLHCFSTIKDRLKKALGDIEGEARYYELLGTANVEHANEFKTLGAAVTCAKLMFQQLVAAETQPTTGQRNAEGTNSDVPF